MKVLARIGVDDVGQGEPVILLHSSCQSRRQWRKLVTVLDGRYRTLALDLAGYGATDFPAHPSTFSIDDEVALVGCVLERLDRPAHLVGHSYGGVVALATARRYRLCVRSLILHEPVVFNLARHAGWAGVVATVEALATGVADRVARGDPDDAACFFIDYWSGHGTWAGISEDRKPEFRRTIAKVPLDFQAIIRSPDRIGDYAALGLPIRLIAGTSGPSPARDVAKLLSGALGKESLTLVEGCGHMAPVTHAHLVNPLIVEHLAMNSASRNS